MHGKPSSQFGSKGARFDIMAKVLLLTIKHVSWPIMLVEAEAFQLILLGLSKFYLFIYFS